MEVTTVLAVLLGCACVGIVVVWLKGGRAPQGAGGGQSDEMVGLRCELEALRATASARCAQLDDARRERELSEERGRDGQARMAAVIDGVRREMTEAVGRLQEEKSAVQRQVATLTSNLQAEQLRGADMERAREELRREASERAAELKRAEAELSAAREQSSALQQRVSEHAKREAELQEAQDFIRQVQIAFREKSERVATLETQVEQQKRALEDKLASLQEHYARVVAELSSVTAELKLASGNLSDAKGQNAADQQRLKELDKREQELSQVRARCDALQGELLKTTERLVGVDAELEQERRGAESKLSMQKELHAQLEERFKGLAAQVLEKNTEKFEQGTKVRLHEMAEALGKQVKELQQKVEQTHSHDTQDRVALRTELQKMVDASKRIDEDATNLARALTGDRKAQGAWGELILERILEQCGLKEGVEYKKQVVLTDDEHRKFRPDVIVNLPGKRSVVVDAKVSLTAYNEYVSAEDGEAAQSAAQRHVASVRNHMRGLTEKEYWRLNGLKTGDYVLMFLPIESAFAEALRHAPSLFEDAFQQQIILTSPATLLATLRTIEHTWRVERQNETARLIVEQAGKLYDKMVGFVEDLKKVGTSLDAAQRSYEGAFSKLSTGKGNLVGQASKLSDLGLKLKKALPEELVDQARAESLPRAVDSDNGNAAASCEIEDAESAA